MGAVHGVHLKYVAMSIGCVQTARSIDSEAQFIAWSAFWYCAILHALIAACFVLRVGMPLIGKSAKTGQVPWWSYVIFWGFHLPTWLYTDLHTRHSVSTGTPVATEVVPGWWIGGRFGDRLKKKWAVTIDLTCEFPEACREVTGPSALPPPPCVSNLLPSACRLRLRLPARQPPVCPSHSALLRPTGCLPERPSPHQLADCRRRRRVPPAPVLGRCPANGRADRAGRAANPNPNPGPNPSPNPGPIPHPSPHPNPEQAAQLAADGYQHGDVMVHRAHPNPHPYIPTLTLTTGPDPDTSTNLALLLVLTLT